MEKIHEKNNRIFALFVLFTTMLTYLFTVAPTVAFWDCGEYIGASHSLGIPHPPGNPLYVLIGRVFSIVFFFFRQVAFRINLISVFSAATTSMLIYLIVVRAMISWMGIPDTSWKRITIYISGIVGAFFCAFGYTFWFSAVEASVYIPSMLVVALCTWIAIVWSQSKDPKRDRLIILFSYIAFLGIAIHMMSMLALIPVGLFIFISDEKKLKDWRLWLTGLSMAAVYFNIYLFLWLGPIVVVLTIVMSFMEKSAAKNWRLCFWIALFALLGYSVHIYIPIRSTAKPIIDENHPVIVVDKTTGSLNWDAFRGFLERKQYGSESMVTRMFHRLGAFNKQFGIDGHMGYGGFHITQFFHFDRSVGIDRNRTVFQNYGTGSGFIRLLLYLIPTFFMIFGMLYFWKRDKKMATLLIFLFLIGSVVLALYMNFADGTRPMKRDYNMWVKNGRQGDVPLQHREVRIRDYFFTTGFMFFGMWIGLATGCLLHALFTNKNRFMRTQLAPILAVLFAVSPALPFSQNLHENNRTKDWVPYDYAYNLLMSCEKNGILFTNGDNDTFPLWFLQEAEGIRRDVRIVNLSLLNTKWYIKQLKELEPIVPISYSINEIDTKLNHQLNPMEKAILYKMPNASIVVQLPGRDTKRALRVQDQMVVNIVDSNKWKKPIYFAVTVSNDNLMGLQPYLQMQGLVYRIYPQRIPQNKRLDIDKTSYLLEKVYSFRSLGDGSAPISETGRKLMSNYAASYIQLGVTMRQPLASLKGDVARLKTPLSDSLIATDSTLVFARIERLKDKENEYNQKLDFIINKMDQCVALMPWDWRPRLLRQEILLGNERFEMAKKRIEEALAIEPDNKEYLKLKGRLFELIGNKSGANEILKKLAKDETDPWAAYQMICKNYEDLGLFDSAIYMMKQFQQIHPGDKRASSMINRFEKMKSDAKMSDTSELKKTESEKNKDS